jgi:hypothetical protein
LTPGFAAFDQNFIQSERTRFKLILVGKYYTQTEEIFNTYMWKYYTQLREIPIKIRENITGKVGNITHKKGKHY